MKQSCFVSKLNKQEQVGMDSKINYSVEHKDSPERELKL